MTRSPAATVPMLCADAIGAVSVGLGSAIAAGPRTWAPRLGLAAHAASRNRALGLADLGLGAAILAGRWAWPAHRWLPVAARSGLHLVFARAYRRDGNPAAAAGMVVLFALDSGVAAALALTR